MSDGLRAEPRAQELPDHHGLAPGEVDHDQAPTRRSRRRRRHLRWVVPLIVLLALVAAVSVLLRPGPVRDQPQVAPPSVPAPTSQAPPAPRYPIEPVAAALPPLEGSDSVLMAALQGLFGNTGPVGSYLQPRDLVRNFVATVDNVPRKTIAPQLMPLKPPPGAFGVERGDGAMTIAGANAQRYRPYVELLDNADLTRLVQLYVSHYPLFQQAYRELGYPNGHFNDRLVEAIDVVLATPVQATSPRVVQPKIFYEFADRSLEQLPAGQKAMLRMGPENAGRVKKRLAELRRLITAEPRAR